jgi:hypothetical protein
VVMVRQRVAGVPANSRQLVRVLSLAFALLCAMLAARAHADPALPSISDEAILGRPAGVTLESVMARYTVFAQDGHGWQSRQSTLGHPGSEWLRVYEPVVEVVFRQGENFRHRFFIPADFVSSASPVVIGPDALTAASKVNQGGSLD